ncbi:cell envelope biogenesis protein TolA [Sphingobium subterraneum]|uniref:Outer membrane biosynthesis protein TonB n=1 Tax=Sphingobium subterraneum TaxID=627688 RepID=A0A841J872_9SPHN|nr:cell envelope biogenesis protein TolA [Sphingobium subterraneum]MBB6124725.1 outer membrane biosynthesis protein TonB [Sphingobium subterraneum]
MERAEKIGLGIATAGHVLLFGLLSAGLFAAHDPLKLRNTPLDVTIVDDVALQSASPRISTEPPPPSQAPEQGPPEEAAPAPPPPEPAPAPVPPKATPAPKPPAPAPKPKPVEKAKPLPKVAAPAPTKAPPKPAPAKAAPAAPAKPAAAPAKTPAKAAPAKGSAERTRASGLPGDFLKGIAPEAPSRPAKPSTSDAAPAATVGPAQKTALVAEISRQIKPHWKAPTGADAEQLRTRVAVNLARDGSVIGNPEVVDTTGVTDSNRTQVRLHQELAVKAIRLAAPFRLPADLYDGWKSFTVNVDKRLSQ